jgi:hypothetical protein
LYLLREKQKSAIVWNFVYLDCFKITAAAAAAVEE